MSNANRINDTARKRHAEPYNLGADHWVVNCETCRAVVYFKWTTNKRVAERYALAHNQWHWKLGKQRG